MSIYILNVDIQKEVMTSYKLNLLKTTLAKLIKPRYLSIRNHISI